MSTPPPPPGKEQPGDGYTPPPPPPPAGGYGQPDPGYASSPYGAQPIGQPYGQPGAQPGAGPKNGAGTTALVTGIIGALSAVFLGWVVVGIIFGIPLGIAALIFGIIGRGKARRGEATNGGAAMTGLILGIVSLLASIGWTVALAFFFNSAHHSLTDYSDCIKKASGDQAKVEQCGRDFTNS